MTRTPFAEILEQVVRDLPGARGAIFIDWEGEAVDAFTMADDTEVRLAGAHWGIVFNHVRSALDKLGQGEPREIMMRFDGQQVIIRRVDEGYMAIITMGPRTNLGRALGLMRRAGARLRREM